MTTADTKTSARSKIPPPVPLSELTPSRIQYALEQLRLACKEVLDKDLIPGFSVPYAHRSSTAGSPVSTLTWSYGVKRRGDPAEGNDVTADTVFAMASVSKPTTTTLLAALRTARGLQNSPPGFDFDSSAIIDEGSG